jgi:hypothetical protein
MKFTVLILVLGIWSATFGQISTPSSAYSKSRPTAKAHWIDQKPIIDGEIISDPVWTKIPAIENMIQTQPVLGDPGSEKTEIRVAYDKEYFYVAAACELAHQLDP